MMEDDDRVTVATGDPVLLVLANTNSEHRMGRFVRFMDDDDGGQTTRYVTYSEFGNKKTESTVVVRSVFRYPFVPGAHVFTFAGGAEEGRLVTIVKFQGKDLVQCQPTQKAGSSASLLDNVDVNTLKPIGSATHGCGRDAAPPVRRTATPRSIPKTGVSRSTRTFGTTMANDSNGPRERSKPCDGTATWTAGIPGCGSSMTLTRTTTATQRTTNPSRSNCWCVRASDATTTRSRTS